MQIAKNCKAALLLRPPAQMLKAMKLTAVLLLVFLMQVSARSFSQKITLNLLNVTPDKVFKEIKRQTGFLFLYNSSELKKVGNVSVKVKEAGIEEVLNQCFSSTPFTYRIVDKTIVITPKPVVVTPAVATVLPPVTIRGVVRDEEGRPLAGVSVGVKGTGAGTTTNVKGEFLLQATDENAVLVFSFVGFESETVPVKGQSFVNVSLKVDVRKLDETVIIGYGTTTRRKSTGSVSSITSEDIAKQPVSNPLNALEGRLAGVVVTQSSGLPGSNVNVLIRGYNSLNQATIPLYIIDGVPFNMQDAASPPSNALNTNTFSAANGSVSPFSMINPADIERIDVLKDADATAIYGTRASNGVVLITTKKAKAGKTKVDVNFYQGTGKVAHFMDMLNLPQYLALRRKAYANDGINIVTANPVDFTVYDTTHYTDWQKKYIGGTAHTTDARATVSGGDMRTRFLLGAGYHRETTVFPGSMNDQRLSVRFNADHNSLDRKFYASISAMYAFDLSNLIATDLSSTYVLPPDYKLYNSNGSLYWDPNFTNPEASLLAKYIAKTNNLLTNAQIRYTVLPGLDVKTSLSFTKVGVNQNQQTPISAQNPANAPTNNARFGIVDQQSYTVEPQVTYTRKIGQGVLTALAGATWQRSLNTSATISGTNYSNPNLLASISGAASYSAGGTYTLYKYNSFFGRLNYAWKEKYIINGNIRRDGSSRFGPNRRFGTFGSVGGAWVMSNEGFFRQALPAVSFAKLRVSYGITGNDRFGDYQFISTYATSSSLNSYQGISILSPSSNVANPELQWETNKKMEFGIDLGFLKDRILLTANYYRNRSDNQLYYVVLPTQTGYNSYSANFAALLQNKGFEFELNTKNIVTKDFTWKTSFNLSIPRNQILSVAPSYFYASSLILGNSQNQVLRFTYKGVDPVTGKPVFRDAVKDSLTLTPNFNTDRRVVGDQDAKLFGGISNDFQYKNWSLGFFIQYTKQDGPIIPSGAQTGPGQPGAPGALGNVQSYWLTAGMWQNPGDKAMAPRASTTSSIFGNMASSDFSWGDNSFVKLRNVSLSYSLPASWLSHIKMSNCRLYMQAQNLKTWTKNKIAFDPETGTSMPPLRVITFGINCSF